jgi:hypothetical protein
VHACVTKLILLLLLLLLQKLLRSAYQGALSYPLIPELEDLHRINSHVLADFVAQHYTGAARLVHCWCICISAFGAFRLVHRCVTLECCASCLFMSMVVYVAGCCAALPALPRAGRPTPHQLTRAG